MSPPITLPTVRTQDRIPLFLAWVIYVYWTSFMFYLLNANGKEDVRPQSVSERGNRKNNEKKWNFGLRDLHIDTYKGG